MKTEDPKYKVPTFTLGELATLKFAVREQLCRWMKWRSDPMWRMHVREAITTYRKLGQSEAAQ
jgi:hypothetical protein